MSSDTTLGESSSVIEEIPKSLPESGEETRLVGMNDEVDPGLLSGSIMSIIRSGGTRFSSFTSAMGELNLLCATLHALSSSTSKSRGSVFLYLPNLFSKGPGSSGYGTKCLYLKYLLCEWSVKDNQPLDVSTGCNTQKGSL